MSRLSMLTYLSDLSEHNEREWFHENKARYTEASQEFEILVSQLMQELCRMDENISPAAPKELTFKLMRDTRFSHDKSPYHPAFRAHIGPKGKLPIPVGYYIMVKPGGQSFLGGGLFADQFKDATTMVRDAITANSEDWERIITAPAFVECFSVKGTALKKVPQGYDPCHPQAAYLKNKSWYLEYPVTDERVTDADFVGFAVRIFAKMKEFNGFLNRALADFQMPRR